MFYANEEKAHFKLENESYSNVCNFLTDLYVYIYKTTNRKPYVNIISENNIGAPAAPQKQIIVLVFNT